jgi:hypothetical protein
MNALSRQRMISFQTMIFRSSLSSARNGLFFFYLLPELKLIAMKDMIFIVVLSFYSLCVITPIAVEIYEYIQRKRSRN